MKINWNKYQSKITIQERNRYLDYLINPSFKGVNRHFALSFENSIGGASYKQYYLLTVELKDYNIMIDEGNLFDQPIRKTLRIFDKIRRITNGQGDDFTTCCFLNYVHFKNQ